jgi:hypothetical protein
VGLLQTWGMALFFLGAAGGVLLSLVRATRQWHRRTVIQLDQVLDTNWLVAGKLTMIKIVSDAQ